ncbi:MAG: LPS-assembly protein LptD [Sterolibacterium sp.]|nr:LPS-assembly protein LptD [Sterolibacterium sp.]
MHTRFPWQGPVFQRVLLTALLAPLSGLSTQAQAADAGAAVVVKDRLLQMTYEFGAPPAEGKETPPSFIEADRISGLNDVETVAEGSVNVRRADNILNADRLVYRQAADEVEAIGHVELRQNEDVISGPHLKLKMAENIGFFEEPQYIIKRAPATGASGQMTVGSGAASRIDFEGKNHYRLSDATYSTCAPADPAWFARASSIQLDYDNEVGYADDATLVFQNVPLLYSPWLTFSLNNKRKSGVLAPTIGTTSKSGFELSVPYYWNIAPNMDATFTPRLMTKRGLALGSEFRYLDTNYNGVLQADVLPDDRVAHRRRSSYSYNHNQNFGLGFSGSLDLNGVSDDTYFSDLSSRMTNIARNNLLRRGTFSYASNWWNISLLAQSYQTLQDPALPPMLVPYRRLPQLAVNAQRADLPYDGLFSFRGEFVRFTHPDQLEGTRTILNPQISLPMQTAAFSLTPKLALHSTTYHLDEWQGRPTERMTRNVPLFSLDGSVVFERPLELGERSMIQTLEPRFYYLRVPSREQDRMPVFDSGLTDFNFAQIFSENRYSGDDRIGDANQLTVAVTSRLIDSATGAERLRGAIGQRFYFKEQSVSLPGETVRTSRTADFLAALSGEINRYLSVDAGLQFNPQDNQIHRLLVSGRYQPEPGKVLSAGYRYNRNQLNSLTSSDVRQIDIAGQWPLSSNWSAVGRYNYSLEDHRVIESVGGLEYNADCWTSRVVLQRIATASGDSSTAFFIQLELNGFASVGSNPLDLLKRSIPGYGRSVQSLGTTGIMP